LTQSTFANSNGLPDPGNKMTVRELAKLARYVVQTYPDLYKLFGEREFTWKQDPAAEPQSAADLARRRDGLKTGFTKEGGYGMCRLRRAEWLAVDRRRQRLEDPDDRASEAKKMLEWGFRNFEARTLFAAQQLVGYARCCGESRSVKLASPEPIKVMVQKTAPIN